MYFFVRGHKGFKFRIYPSERQEQRLLAWESALRFLWNLALEQRKLGLGRPARLYPNAFDQISELKALCAELPFLADVPRNVCAQLLVELDRAWQRCFKRLARAPRCETQGQGHSRPHRTPSQGMASDGKYAALSQARQPANGRPSTSRRQAEELHH